MSPSPGFDYSIRKGGPWGCFLDSYLLLPSFTRIACSLCPLPLLGIHLWPSHYSIVIMLCTDAVVIVIVIVFGFASSVSKLYDVLVLGGRFVNPGAGIGNQHPVIQVFRMRARRKLTGLNLTEGLAMMLWTD